MYIDRKKFVCLGFVWEGVETRLNNCDYYISYPTWFADGVGTKVSFERSGDFTSVPFTRVTTFDLSIQHSLQGTRECRVGSILP